MRRFHQNDVQKRQNVTSGRADLQSHFEITKNCKKGHFVQFWALGPIKTDSWRDFRSNGFSLIDFRWFSCDFGPKQGSTSSQLTWLSASHHGKTLAYLEL